MVLGILVAGFDGEDGLKVSDGIVEAVFGYPGLGKYLLDSALYKDINALEAGAMILVIVAGATIFGHFLAITRIPFDVAGWVTGANLPSYLVMALIIGVYLIGGCFIDALAFIMLTVPILLAMSYATAHPLTLDFNTLQIGALILTIILAWKTTDDGETNYFEGTSHLIFFTCYAIVLAFM